MVESKSRLITYLNALGISIDKDIFESRIKAQKMAYILQTVLDTKLYEDFNFYIRGPYSRKLAVDYFSDSKGFKEGKSNYQPTKPESEEIKRIRPMIMILTTTDLEIVASLLYLRKELLLDEESAERMLHERKPHLKLEDIWRGTNTIKKLFLTDLLKEKLMKSLKDEMKDWDELSNESLNKFGQ